MKDSIIMFLVDLFFKIENEGRDGFILIKFSVPLGCLWKLYERLKLIDVKPIEDIEKKEKEKYWNIAKRFYTDQEQAIKASKAAYMLSLITSS
jgi:hypothetical protein